MITLQEGTYNPLEELLELFSGDGLLIGISNVLKVRELLAKGGINCDSAEEALSIISIFSDLYNITEIHFNETTSQYSIRKINGQE